MPDEHVAGARRDPRVERRRHADLDRRGEVAPPRRAPASASARPSPVGLERRRSPAISSAQACSWPGRCAPAADTISAHSTARRCRGSSRRTASQQRPHDVGEVVAAEQEERHRRTAQRGRRARPSAARAASTTASRQLSASRSRRIELRSTAALHGSAYGRSVIVVTHSASAVQRRRPLAALVELLEGEGPHRLQHPVAHAVADRGARATTMLLCTSDATCSVAAGVVDAQRAGDVLRRRRARSRWGTRPATGTAAARRRRAGGTTSRSWPAWCRGGRRPGAGRRCSSARAVVEGADDRRARRAWRSRAAASSMASGMPSSRRQRSLDRRSARPSRGRHRPPPPAAGTARRRSCRVERPHRDHVLAVDAERLAAGREHRQAGHAAVSAVDHARRRCRRRARSCRRPAACARRRAAPSRRPAGRSTAAAPIVRAIASATSSGSVTLASSTNHTLANCGSSVGRGVHGRAGSCRRRRRR